MLFITKRKLDRLLDEERRKYVSLGFDCGYKACQSDNGGLGFITGSGVKVRWLYGLQQAEQILKEKGM